MIKLVFILCACSLSPVFAGVSLPAIGQDSNYQLQREQEIGERFHQRLLRANKIVDDPLVNFYLKEVTSILLQSLDENYRSFKISIIDDSAINAFAVPGGYIGINYGLVLAAQTESQLAGVLAHEISHITLNHLSQLLQKQDSTNNALIASMLLALVLSQSLDGEEKGEAVEALVLGGAAGAQQAMINFTRENEYEADRKGLELMIKSGYPAVGMAEFFSILEGEGGGEIASIEYLRTHPVSENRMGEAYQFRAKKSLNHGVDSVEYELFKVYLSFLVNGEFKSHKNSALVVQYESALKAIKLNEQDLAVQILQKIYNRESENIWVMYELIKLYILRGKYDSALKLINNALDIYPQQGLFLSQKIKVLVLLKKFEDALVLAEKELNRNEENQKVRYAMVSIYEQLGKENKARETEGDFMLKQGNRVRAKYLYRLVLNAVTDTRSRQGLLEKIKKLNSLKN